MKKLFIIASFFIVSNTFAQKVDAPKTEGVIIFERTERWTKIISHLSYLSQEEKDRAANTWKNEEESEWNKSKLLLSFNEKESLYTQKKDVEAIDGWAGRKEDYYIHRNFEQEKRTELLEMLGKTYVLEDSLRTMNWKVMNQLKEVAGFVCMKAVTEDTIKKQKITAWFSQEIPVQAGPERYFGLPGMILELEINDGDVEITATKIDFKKLDKELTLPKLKGKKIKVADYDKLITTHIKDSITAHRNPYWAIRY